ncbi:MAG: hypothetical protein MH137_05635 [Flavobacteriales bacterium]|nr:hypothetical protein [Flavobacteriales bacterium]
MNIKLFFLTVGMFGMLQANAQTRKYEVVLSGNKIGELTATKTVKGAFTTYKLESKSEAKVLFSTKKNYVLMDVTYKDGILVSSYCKNEINDEVDNYASINWDGSKYNITNEKKKFTHPTQVKYSVISLYFSEPKGMTQLFTERIGEVYPLTDLGSGKYEYKIPNGDKNVYVYKNGELVETERKTIIGTVYVKLVK